jgi:hypothetical protein
MFTKSPVFLIPIPSTESVTDPTLDVFGCAPVLRIDYYRDGVAHRSGIQFNKALATRTRTERCCTAWHVESAYDTLVEVLDSPWVVELRDDIANRWKNAQQMHHYMIYLDSAGCFEVVSESYEVLPEGVGSWARK